MLSLLLAFVPEHEMTTAKKLLWRSSVILVGFIWSVVLWHQQVIVDKTTRDDQERIVNQAVSKSNEHSDQQIKSVQGDIGGVKKDVGEVKIELQQSTSDITIGIGKIGKPAPPKLARLELSLFKDDMKATDLPILQDSITADKDGVVVMGVTFTNVSDTIADVLEVWLGVGDVCVFTEEPQGSERPPGMAAAQRHFNVPAINAGVSHPKIVLKVKCPAPIPYRFPVSFRYSCKTCGPMSKIQLAWITVPAAFSGITPPQ